MTKKAVCFWFLILAVGLSVGAFASGFSVYEQSAKASGQAGAWVARADDAAAQWYNPAATVWLEDNEFQLGGNAIFAGGDTEVKALDSEFLIFESTTYKAESQTVTPVHLYFHQKIGDRMAWGIGINNPYGLISEWRDLPVSAIAKRSELVTFVVNPNFSLKIAEEWALGFGIDYIYAEVKEFSSDIATVVVGPAGPQWVRIGEQNLTGDGDDWGWNLALHHKGENLSFGLTYRSSMSPAVDGDLDFSGVPLPDSPGGATLDLPSSVATGIAWNLAGWEMEFDVTWTEWSRFENLTIEVDHPSLPDVVLREDWDDTFSYRFGTSHVVADVHELRFGLLYDENPVPADTLRPSIPDADRWAPTIGYGYLGDRWSFDFYYMPLFFDDARASGSAAEGVLDGEYSSFGHLTGITLHWRF